MVTDVPGVLRIAIVQPIARLVYRVDTADKRRLGEEDVPKGIELVRHSGRDKRWRNRSAARHNDGRELLEAV